MHILTYKIIHDFLFLTKYFTLAYICMHLSIRNVSRSEDSFPRVTDRLGQVIDVVRGKWRRETQIFLALPSGEEVSTRKKSQDALARHYFLQAD